MKPDTIIFDLDGTIVDTLEDLTDSVNMVLTNKNFPTRTAQEIASFMGNGVESLIELALNPEEDKKIVNLCITEFRSYYTQNLLRISKPYNGVIDLFEALTKRNIKIAIVSNKFEIATRKICDTFFRKYTKVVIGGRSNLKRKPAPDSLLEALRLSKSKAENTICLGDTEVDFQTAKNAGITFIGVSWGFRNREYLTGLGVSEIIDNPMQLLDYIDNKD